MGAVCLFDDCVEHCGAAAARAYAPMLLEGIREALDTTGLQDEGEVELKKAAVYGLAQIARHAPTSLPPATGLDLLSKLYEIAKEVETVPKGDLEHVALVENTVSAMASLALFPGSPLFDAVPDKGALMNVFLRCLPLEEDFDEAKICHDGLCDLVEANSINIQSEYRTLLRIISRVLFLV